MSDEALQALLDEARPGPWRPEPLITGEGLRRRRGSLWLTNDDGDSLYVDEDTAARLVNAALIIAGRTEESD